MDLKDIITAFAAENGLEGLTADAEGAYHIGIDDMVVSFSETGNRDEFVTWAEVAVPQQEGRERLYRALMEAMFLGQGTGGATFSLERESGEICLHRIDNSAQMDLNLFKEKLEKFVNILEQWRKLMADFAPVAHEIEEAARNSEQETRQFGLGGFMQV